jgi:hypothetical protein
VCVWGGGEWCIGSVLAVCWYWWDTKQCLQAWLQPQACEGFGCPGSIPAVDMPPVLMLAPMAGAAAVTLSLAVASALFAAPGPEPLTDTLSLPPGLASDATPAAAVAAAGPR